MGIVGKAKDIFLGSDEEQQKSDAGAQRSEMAKRAIPTAAKRSTQDWLRNGSAQLRAAARRDRNR